MVCRAAYRIKEMKMAHSEFVPHPTYEEYPLEEMKRRAVEFSSDMRRRRTVRDFSDRPVPREVIADCLRAAGSAPSGANMQPWHFVVVGDAAVKREIRLGAEKADHEFYHHKAPPDWLEALAPLGTCAQKPFLETAPYLIVVFAQTHGVSPDGRAVKHYYVRESVGIATGILITAVHHAGLASLTYTPSRMAFLNDILGRTSNERPFLVLVVGYPAADAQVPAITRKPLEEIATFL
jgi:iodotyrosine deiodinase